MYPYRLARLDHVRNIYKDTEEILPAERSIKKKQVCPSQSNGTPLRVLTAPSSAVEDTFL